MTTRITGKLPGGDTNGLGVIAHALLNRPKETHVVIAVLSTKQITEEVETGDRIPTAQVLAIEVINPDPGLDDLETAQRLMRRASERRHGGEMLPIEIEDEFTELFARVDREHMEERRAAEEAAASGGSDPCPACGGTGDVRDEEGAESGPCPACDGTGELSPAPADDVTLESEGLAGELLDDEDPPADGHGPQFSG